ncbi:MAG: DUF87 domain-containing protein [Candidatus Cloacimonetes bacterium]|nr:DUF87 domain-containing protein [Candidatus Cloacimonadota bacterium]
METNNALNLKNILLWLVLLIIAVLLLVAVSSNAEQMLSDYRIISESGMNLWDILSLDFPDLHNPIGPFGAILGYWLSYLFGKILCVSLLIGLALLSFFNIFTIYRENVVLKLISFVIMAFFINIIVLTMRNSKPLLTGIITNFVLTLLNRLFDVAGTIIISSVIIIVMTIIIFELGPLWRAMVWLLDTLKSFFHWIFKKKEKAVKEKKLDKIIKIPKAPHLKVHNDPEPALDYEDEPVIPTVTDEPEENQRFKPVVKKKIPINNSEPVVPFPEEKDETAAKSKIRAENKYSPPQDGNYTVPNIEDFLKPHTSQQSNREELKENIARTSEVLMNKLAEFQVEATVKNVNIGPIVTQYELEPAPGVKVNTFNNLSKDLALALKANSLRVEAPIPGRGLIGIELPNEQRDIIYLRDIMLSKSMRNMESILAFGLGKDISGNPVVADLAKMPHLLVAGATGSGKSVCVNSIIVSLLLRAKPSELRLILIDPKRIELAGYEGIPHLIQNVVTEPEHVMITLNWAVSEMDRRYKLLQIYGVRNLQDYNIKIKEMRKADPELEEKELPYIVVIIDEFSDLIMTATKEIERPVTRLAQMARAIGIHLILATQRPSTKVITGLIKANFPSRIAFKVTQKINSRVILDVNGAEQLLGKGDSLFHGPGQPAPVRIHGAFVSDIEINNLVDYLRVQPRPDDDITIISDTQENLAEFDYDDDLFPEAAFIIVNAGSASVSMLQRHFKIGYARAGRLIDLLEQARIVGPHLGSKSREVLASEQDLRDNGLWLIDN